MKVSVIVPSYNYGHLISETLDSVLSQTYKDWECIIVDDGSTDNTRQIVEKYVKRDGRFKYLHQKNKGPAGAKNTGVFNASGEYIQLLDADDLLHPEKIRLQLDFCLSQKSLISYCETVQFSDNVANQRMDYIGPVDDMLYRLYNFWLPYPIPVHSLLIKRTIFERHGLFDEAFKAIVDRFFFCKLALANVKFDYFPFVGAYRRKHAESMARKIGHRVKYIVEFYQKMVNEADDSLFVSRYGFTPRQLMNANLTYIYLCWVAGGVERRQLNLIKRLLSESGVRYTIEAIPDGTVKRSIPHRYLYYWLECYGRRYARFLRTTLKNLLLIFGKG